jgi:hypothetical protein
MDFKDLIRQLGDRVNRLKDQTLTEEATKHAFVLPFLQTLGYDVFNPAEIIPEFIADVGIKKGEKVDFVVMKDKCPVILIECKHWKEKLDNHDGQLLRYFHVCKAKFSVLTNGVQYRFFTDLAQANIMDTVPFLEFDITAITDQQAEELKKFHKSYFDENTIKGSASELKYTAALRAVLASEFKTPSEAFVRYFTKQVYTGMVTDKVIFQFSDLLRKSIQNTISDMVSDRLKSALDKEQQLAKQAAADQAPEAEEAAGDKERLIVTTPEEMEGFYIIKSILRRHVDPNRITFRDAQSYMAILLDDNNRKTIARLYFNGNKKSIATIDAAKKEVKSEIKDLDDIYQFGDKLKATVDTYVALKS